MSKGKVLICDDDPHLVEMTSLALSSVGYEVNCLSDMKSLMVTVKSFRPEVILIDLQMPTLDGYQVVNILRNDNFSKQIPILLFSANTELERIAGQLKVGFMHKPFSIHELRDCIKNLIQQ